MADAQRTIELIFEGVDKTGAATLSAIKNTNAFAANLEAATQPLADFTLGALKLEAGVIAAGAALTAFSVKVAGDFDAAFREIASLLDVPIEQLGEFRQSILDYAGSSTQSIDEITTSLYQAISNQVDYAESLDVLNKAEQLAVAGRAGLTETTLALVQSLNAYGLGMDQAQRFSDALFTTVKLGSTTLPQLAGSLSQVTGSAATLQIPFETLLAAIATLTTGGATTEQAITRLNQVMTAFIKPSSEASTIADDLGINFSAAAVKSKGFETVLQEVITATGGSEEKMGRLFGSADALKAIFPLAGAASEQFRANLAAFGDTAGATAEAFGKLKDDINLGGQTIANTFTKILIAIGTPLLDEFGGVAAAISSIFNSIAGSATAGKVKELVDYIEAQFGRLEDVLATVAENLPAALEMADFSGFKAGLDAVIGAIGRLFENVDITSAEGLASVITLIGQAFEGLSQFSAGVIDSFGPAFEAIVALVDGMRTIDPETFRSIGETLGFIGVQANLAAGAIAGLTVVIGINQTAGLIGAMGALKGAASGGLAALGTLIGSGTAAAGVGVLGLSAAAGASAYAVGTLANKATELGTGTSLSTRLLDWAASMGWVSDAGYDIVAGLNDIAPAADSAGTSVKALASDLQLITTDFSDLDRKFGIITELEPLADRIKSTAGAVDTLTESTKKLDLDERLELIRSRTAIITSTIEGDTRRIEAAFESVSTSVDSTQKALSDLFGLLGNENVSKLDKLSIAEQIKLENERRQESLDLQEKLTKAIIAETKARTERLRGGDALITVNGDGLQPHLEAFMWAVLEAVQVRVNADGLDLLLGTG